MPTYQYACTACGHQLEAVQSFSDEPLTECPSCQGRLRKVFNSVGIVFKGSGFYRTDSRSGGGSDTVAAGKTGGKSESGNGQSTNGGGSGGDSGSSSKSSNGDSGGGTAAAKPAAATSSPSSTGTA